MTADRGYMPVDAPPHDTLGCGRERMGAGLDACRWPAACACEAALMEQQEREGRDTRIVEREPDAAQLPLPAT